ncbi:MAG TPA: orotidine-5'-phosphate decarboxylase [Acidobacteriaceae bacterium]|nr:orotidine-5'-phosphate decarboxylase [Acidobacteriaceae bacterium]
MPHSLASQNSDPSRNPAARSPKDRLIVALDVPTAAQARELARQLSGICRWVKVGLELYLAAGAAIVEELASQGFSVFLDLKFHDIPNTVAGAVRSAASMGASLLTVHAAGGPAMLAAAAEAAAAQANSPRLLAVTVLTSMDAAQLAAIGVDASPADQVLRLARMAQNSGIDGLVCSAEEIRVLRQELGPAMQLVIPGIRPAGSEVGDQKRISTPADAIRAGANALVVGRPITKASNPAQAAEAILKEIASAVDETRRSVG